MVVVKYARTGVGMFFAHSDVIRIWNRIFAISGVSILPKSVSNPDKRIYFSLPTRVNVESYSEYVAIDTKEDDSVVKNKIENNLPPWMDLIFVCETKERFSISTINNCARYIISFDEYKTFKGKIKEFFAQPEIYIDVELHGEKKHVNVKDRIFKVEYKDDEFVVFAGVNKQSVRIDELAKVLMKYLNKPWEQCSVIKAGLYVHENDTFKDIDEILKKAK